MVRNISRAGLFAETPAQALPGDRVALCLRPALEVPELDVHARVVWRRSGSGVGLEIASAPGAYYTLVERAALRPRCAAPSATGRSRWPSEAGAAKHPFAYFAPWLSEPSACSRSESRPNRVKETCTALSKAVLGALTRGALRRR